MFALVYLHVFFVPLQGVLNTSVYLYPRIVNLNDGNILWRFFHVVLAKDMIESDDRDSSRKDGSMYEKNFSRKDEFGQEEPSRNQNQNQSEIPAQLPLDEDDKNQITIQ